VAKAGDSLMSKETFQLTLHNLDAVLMGGISEAKKTPSANPEADINRVAPYSPESERTNGIQAIPVDPELTMPPVEHTAIIESPASFQEVAQSLDGLYDLMNIEKFSPIETPAPISGIGSPAYIQPAPNQQYSTPSALSMSIGGVNLQPTSSIPQEREHWYKQQEDSHRVRRIAGLRDSGIKLW
jgi:hypothetical protein